MTDGANMSVVSPASVVGQSELHLCTGQQAERVGVQVHRQVVEPFLALRTAAANAGFRLAGVSGFRSFERQLSIFNRKVGGELAVLDSQGVPIPGGTLSDRDLVLAILRWSALPGASRHHWGTDIDVYDAAAVAGDYEVQLTPNEVAPGGVFGPLHAWLDTRIAAGGAFGFFRPYDVDRGGVAPERWHLSHGPTASSFAALLTLDTLRDTLAASDLLLKDTVLELLPSLYQRFVIRVNGWTW